MARPRIFISSTYYDLKHIRNNLEVFVSQFGYEAVLFESGDIPFHHNQPLDESCYSEIHSCHILVLIIGGRYGTAANEDLQNEEVDKIYKSITKKEYETAREKDIPIYIFVEKSVMAEYQTYKENKKNETIVYAHVDSVGVFYLLDDILSQGRNNLIKEFEKFNDISSWLTDQWAGIFAEFLSKKSADATLRNLSSQVEELKQLSGVLKSYNESIIRKLQPEASKKIIRDSDKKLILSKANRLYEEPMISYLRNKYHLDSPPLTIYRALENSDSLEDFLIRMKLAKPDWVHFMDQNKNHAENDYREMLHLYVNRTDVERIPSSDEDEQND